jgi:ureidoglycolate hydrolase
MTTIRACSWNQVGGEWARLIIPSGFPKPEAGAQDYSYHQVLGPGELGESGIMAELICRKRPLVLGTLERHLATPEILAALDGDVIVCAAAPGVDPAHCAPADIRALMLRQGQAMWMDRGTWHWLPFPTRTAQVTVLLIFREGTGDRDIELRELAQPVGIEADPPRATSP